MKINKRELEKFCTVSPEYFIGDEPYRLIDMQSDILAVAHVDTVYTSNPYWEENGTIYSPGLDDRLGVYTLFELANKCKFDILLTTDEEKGMSTAQLFETDKQYKWMFQFDRRGTGAVMYEYENADDWYTACSYRFHIWQGSYSDISYLTHLHTCGINIGTGYYDEHTYGCHMDVRDWNDQVKLFLNFYDDNVNRSYPYNPAPAHSPYSWLDEDTMDWCDLCGKVGEVKYSKAERLYLCEECDTAFNRWW